VSISHGGRHRGRITVVQPGAAIWLLNRTLRILMQSHRPSNYSANTHLMKSSGYPTYVFMKFRQGGIVQWNITDIHPISVNPPGLPAPGSPSHFRSPNGDGVKTKYPIYATVRRKGGIVLWIMREISTQSRSRWSQYSKCQWSRHPVSVPVS